MKLTIAFITRNRKNEIVRAIQSCICQVPRDVEFVIVDNASNDSTEDAIKKLLKDQYKLIYYYSKINLGVSGGRNKAFNLSNGEYVFFLDDDAIIASENFFDEMINYLEANREVVALSPDIQEPKTKTNLNSESVYKIKGFSTIYSFCGCAHILRKDFFDRIGRLYPDKLAFGSEELYASIIAHSCGKKVVEYKKIKVEHYPSKINRCAGAERDFNFIFNQYLIKCYLYPVSVQWITLLFYYIHKTKNGYANKKWKIVEKKLFLERYEKECIYRISIASWWKIFKRYGLKTL